MDIRKLQRAIVDGLEDVKAQNIAVFNTEHLSPLFERVIIASGTSNRQTKALASSVRDAVRDKGFPVLRTEGEANGEWIIVDCGAAVVHVMQPAIRDYYHLEEIWGDKSVRMKMGTTGPVRLVKAEAPARPDKPDARKAPAKKATAARTPARKPTAAKTATARAVARKTAAAKPPSRRPAVQPAAARKATATKAAPKKAAPKKATPRKATAKRPVAKRPTRA